MALRSDSTIKVTKTILSIVHRKNFTDIGAICEFPAIHEESRIVEVTALKISRWTAKGPAGAWVRWDAEITEDRSNEYIAWRSLENADVENSGSVRFSAAPGGRGTLSPLRCGIPASRRYWGDNRKDFRPSAGTTGRSGLAKVQASHGDRRNNHHRRAARRPSQQHIVEV